MAPACDTALGLKSDSAFATARISLDGRLYLAAASSNMASMSWAAPEIPFFSTFRKALSREETRLSAPSPCCLTAWAWAADVIKPILSCSFHPGAVFNIYSRPPVLLILKPFRPGLCSSRQQYGSQPCFHRCPDNTSFRCH